MDLGRNPGSGGAPGSTSTTRASSSGTSTSDILSAIASMNLTGGGAREEGYPQEMMPFPGMLPMGGPEFTLPFDFFFSGFQCIESLAGGSTVAIDNKIEQAMDLVKRHLMYAVREEVEILKQQIGEMMERIGQLEYENTVLRAEAKPETLNKLLLPRVTQAQPTSALPAPTSAAPAPQQGQPSTSAQALANHNTQNVTPQSQTQIHVQPPAQPVPQQQVQPTPGQQGTHAPSQAGHPPST